MSTFILHWSEGTSICWKTNTVLSYWRFPVTIPQNPQNDTGISASSAQSWICCYSKSPFQYFAVFIVLAPQNDLLRACTGGSTKKQSLDCRMGKHFPAKLFDFLQCQVYSVRVCTIMLKNDASSHWAGVTKCILQFLEKLHVVNCTDNLLSGQIINQYPPLDIPENWSHHVSGQRVWFRPSSYLEM